MDTSSLKSRELWIIVSCILFAITASTYAFWMGRIDSAQWLNLIQWAPVTLAGIFGASQRVKEAIQVIGNRSSNSLVQPMNTVVAPVVAPAITLNNDTAHSFDQVRGP
jgi:hypothetical protein